MARYACSDLHGRYDLYQGILDFIKPEDTVYFLGDANDRGNAGWRLIKEIYENSQFIYLKGNHEDILAHALLEYFDQGPVDGYWYRMCMNNGGYQTFEDAISDPDVQTWIARIQNLPLTAEVDTFEGKVLMCHSGNYWGTHKEKVWCREHFNWPVTRDNAFIVHGHTPTRYVYEEIFGPNDDYQYKVNNVLFYGQDDEGEYHKIDLDVGAVWNDFTVLLNLDTFEITKITTPETLELVRM